MIRRLGDLLESWGRRCRPPRTDLELALWARSLLVG